MARFEYDCSVLPKVIHSVPHFWVLYTLIRDWIGKTINRISEGGLHDMWSIWEERAILMAWKIGGQITMNTEDIIGARRVGCLGGLGITLAILCLISEK